MGEEAGREWVGYNWGMGHYLFSPVGSLQPGSKHVLRATLHSARILLLSLSGYSFGKRSYRAGWEG